MPRLKDLSDTSVRSILQGCFCSCIHSVTCSHCLSSHCSERVPQDATYGLCILYASDLTFYPTQLLNVSNCTWQQLIVHMLFPCNKSTTKIIQLSHTYSAPQCIYNPEKVLVGRVSPYTTPAVQWSSSSRAKRQTDTLGSVCDCEAGGGRHGVLLLLWLPNWLIITCQATPEPGLNLPKFLRYDKISPEVVQCVPGFFLTGEHCVCAYSDLL